MSGSDNFESIEHDGIVQRSDNNSVTIKILSVSACAGCHAEGSCSLSGMEEKNVETPGDHVTVVMKKSAGYAAVMLGYVFPLILLILVLIILASSGVSELEAGLGAISVLIPYYFILWVFRKRISKKFTFTIKA
jgi:positive regulator of sigma E activity